MTKLTEAHELLLKVANLCIEELPKGFVGIELNNRIWRAFRLGEQYEKLQQENSRDEIPHKHCICGREKNHMGACRP